MVSYTLAGANNATASSASGTFTVDVAGKASVTVVVPANSVLNDAGTLTLSAGGKTSTVSVTDATVAPPVAPVAPDPTYSITSSATTVAEGGAGVIFTLNTTNVKAGTTIAYTIKGTGDAANQTTSGLFTVDSSGVAVSDAISVPSNTTYGDSGSLLLSLANGKASSSAVSVTDSTAAPSLDATVSLTAGIDSGAVFTGGAGNDTYNAVIGASPTLNALDAIDGGAGANVINIVDTNVTTQNGGSILPALISIKNVQTMNVRSIGAVGLTGANKSFDTSGTTITGLTALNVSASTGADFIIAGSGQAVTVVDTAGTVTLVGGSSQTVNTAGGYALSKATGAINVTDTAQDNVASTVDDGTSVNVTSTSTTATGGTSGAITIGNTTQPTGAIVVVDNLANAKAAATNMAGGTVTVKGGTTVSVTQNATQAVMTTAGTNSTLTEAAVAITGGTATTAVTVANSAAVVVANTVDKVAAVTETHSLVFSAMTAAQTVTVNGLTFTATGAVTAAQAAAAFASLSNGATQGTSTLGTYSGTFGTVSYASGAASSATLVLTSNATGNVTDVTVSSVGATSPAVTTVGGVTAVAASGKGGVTANTITITDVNNGDALKAGTIASVTASNYTTLTVNDNALTTLSATGGSGNITIANGGLTTATNKTLGLTLNGVTGGTLDDADIYTTINVTTAGTKSTLADITDTALTALTVGGTTGLTLTSAAGMTALKTVIVTGAAGLTATISQASVTAFDASASTGAQVITLNTTRATYTGSAGADTLTTSAGVSRTISLGDGDDTLTLASGTTALTGKIDGGTGTNTLVMATADAATASANSAFGSSMSNFQKLKVTGQLAAGSTASIDLSNMTGISYVVSANTAAGSGTNVTETASVPFLAITAGQSYTFGGLTVKAVGGTASLAMVEAAIVSGTTTGFAQVSGALSGWTAGNGPTSATDGIVLFTSTTASANVTDPTVTVGGLAAYTGPTGAATAGGAAAAFSVYTILTGLVAGQSLTINGLTVTASVALTTAQVANAFVSTNVVVGATLTGTATTMGTGGGVANALAPVVSAGTSTVTFTNNIVGVTVADLTASTGTTAVTAPAAVTVTSVQGDTLIATGLETFTKMANNGTLELSAAGSGVTVTMADATGLADSFNVVVKATSGVNVGTQAVAGVETINITSTDPSLTNAAGTISHTLALSDSSLKTVMVSGNASLTLSSSNTSITSVDGSGMTGALTYTTAGTTAETVKAGALGSSLTAAAGTQADSLIGGAGNDTLTVNAGLDVLTGGAGKDNFVIQTAAVNCNVYSTITDASSSDKITFATGGTEVWNATKLALGSTATFQDFANLAAAGTGANTNAQVSWFQFGGDTYLVQDRSASASFVNGTDIMVKLTGLIDCSGASFNSAGTLVIA